jgi:hypothetical protein
MSKKLTLSNLTQSVEEKKSYFSLTINEEWEVNIRNEFDSVGISKVTQNMVKTIHTLRNISYSSDILSPYVYIYIIKEFTDLGEEIPSDIDSVTKVIRMLIEEDLFIPIIENLPKSEVEKVVADMQATAEGVNLTFDELEEKMKKNESFIKNIEVKDALKV